MRRKQRLQSQVKMAKGKKAMELSINFIVTLILAIVVFSMGLSIAFKLVNKVTNVQKDVDESTKQQIEGLILRTNQRVVLPFNSKIVNKGKTEVFNVGIYNNLGTQKNFKLDISCLSLDRNPCPGGPIPGSSSQQPTVDFIRNPALIQNNDFTVYKIAFQTKSSTSVGTFYYGIKVMYEPTLNSGSYANYPPAHQIVLKVA